MTDPHLSGGTARFTAATVRDVAVLTLEGSLDYISHRTADEFFDQAFLRYGPRLVIDLLEVDFMDSRATGLLVGCWRRAVEEKGWVALVAVRPGAARVLWITGIASRVPVFDTVEAAVDAAPARP
jgi:anti-anti-sigma factor